MLEYRNELIGSLGIHIILGLALALGESCAPKISPPKKVTMVSMISLPVQKSDVLTNATQRPKAKEMPIVKEKVAEPSSVPEPPPSTPDQMVLNKEQPKPEEPKPEEPKPEPKKKEEPKESNQSARDALMRQMEQEEKREELLKGIPEGPKDREATSPDGVENATNKTSTLGKQSPEIAAYIASALELIKPNWSFIPKSPSEQDEREVTIQVSVASNGSISTPKILTSSGDNNFDKSAIRSLYKTNNIGVPPKKWIADGGKSITITLSAKDK